MRFLGAALAVVAACGPAPVRQPERAQAPPDEGDEWQVARPPAAVVDGGPNDAPPRALPAPIPDQAETCRKAVAASGTHAAPEPKRLHAILGARWCGERRTAGASGLSRIESEWRDDGVAIIWEHHLGPDGRGGHSESSRDEVGGCWMLAGEELWLWSPYIAWRHSRIELTERPPRLTWEGVTYQPCAPRPDPFDPPK